MVDKYHYIENILYQTGNQKIIRLFFRYDHSYVMAMDIEEMRELRMPFDVGSFRRAGVEDIPRLAKLVAWSDGYGQRLAEGQECFIAERGGSVVAMQWVKRARNHFEEETEFLVDMGEDCLWTYDGFVDPAYRLTGLWPAMKSRILKQAVSSGLRKTCCLIRKFNTDSVASQLRLGLKIYKELIYIRLFFLRAHLTRKIEAENKWGKWRLKLWAAHKKA